VESPEVPGFYGAGDTLSDVREQARTGLAFHVGADVTFEEHFPDAAAVVSSVQAASAIAMLLQIPWSQSNRKILFSLGLYSADGKPVNQPGPAGDPVPVLVRGELEVGRPPGIPEGSMLDAPLAINIQSLVLAPGQRHCWELEINDEKREDWRLAFFVRPMVKG
jgi:predicted RNase H-like HicB family nuclease